jgi:hypothetical protein
MNPPRYSGWVVIVLACAAGSYVATYAMQQPRNGAPSSAPGTSASASVADWLGLTPQQAAEVREIEAGFAADRVPLEATLAAERERLAAALENPASTNDEILQQVEKVIAAHNALERRVAAHLIAMRPHLAVEQQRRLFERFASGVRESGGRGWRHGQAGNTGGQRRGGGPPPGRGTGRGHSSESEGRGRPGERTATAPTSQP